MCYTAYYLQNTIFTSITTYQTDFNFYNIFERYDTKIYCLKSALRYLIAIFSGILREKILLLKIHLFCSQQILRSQLSTSYHNCLYIVCISFYTILDAKCYRQVSVSFPTYYYRSKRAIPRALP